MSEAHGIAVVGTGVVGLAVACELLDRGLRVTVVGPRGGDHRGQASRAAGAMLSTFSEIEPGHDPARPPRGAGCRPPPGHCNRALLLLLASRPLRC